MRPLGGDGRGLWLAIKLALLMAGLAFVMAQGLAGAAARLDRKVISSGGSVAAKSPTHRVSGTLGQVASNRGGSPTVDLGAGFWNTAVPACDCRYHGDLDGNGVVNVFDVVRLVDATFRSGPSPPKDPFCPHANRGDYNCDGVLSITDVVWAVSVAFRGGSIPCDPCKKK
jgi:hypothetical protein